MTCHRFARPRPVAATGLVNTNKRLGVKPSRAKAVTGHRTPKHYLIDIHVDAFHHPYPASNHEDQKRFDLNSRDETIS